MQGEHRRKARLQELVREVGRTSSWIDRKGFIEHGTSEQGLSEEVKSSSK